jgi:hypothetical protein
MRKRSQFQRCVHDVVQRSLCCIDTVIMTWAPEGAHEICFGQYQPRRVSPREPRSLR